MLPACIDEQKEKENRARNDWICKRLYLLLYVASIRIICCYIRNTISSSKLLNSNQSQLQIGLMLRVVLS